jgi:hypothetical protein
MVVPFKEDMGDLEIYWKNLLGWQLVGLGSLPEHWYKKSAKNKPPPPVTFAPVPTPEGPALVVTVRF